MTSECEEMELHNHLFIIVSLACDDDCASFSDHHAIHDHGHGQTTWLVVVRCRDCTAGHP